MHKGQKVIVEEAFAGEQVKAVVDWNDRLVFVCREEEYENAKKESREPNSVGFPQEFIRAGCR